jgi:hypothetical protein
MFRPRRFFWLLGLALLVSTAAGAGWVLNHSHADEGPTVARDKDLPASAGIFSIGYMDVEAGVANLYPLQTGRIIWVVKEGAKIRKGKDNVLRVEGRDDDVLLRLDDRLARADLQRAEAALKETEGQLAKAKLLPRQHEEKLKQLEAAVAAGEAEKAAAQQQVEILKRAVQNKVAKVEELRAAEETVKKADALVHVAQSKLREAKDYRPQLDRDRDRAEAAVAEKQALRDKARIGVDECVVRAPSAGEILRVLVSIGDVLSPTPRGPALVFCPEAPRIIRAEVQQEWSAKVKEGQEVVIADDTHTGQHWNGRVKRLSDWFAHRRSIIQEPFQFNDVRTLECLVEFTGPQPALRIGQRMRVMIQQGGL